MVVSLNLTPAEVPFMQMFSGHIKGKMTYRLTDQVPKLFTVCFLFRGIFTFFKTAIFLV